jgi:antitoxin (DNA-binding transcriptional repressor) of toxin-antitoxin stability system
MPTVNIRDAETHLSRPIKTTANGETVMIAKARQALGERTALDAPTRPGVVWASWKASSCQAGFDTMGRAEIEQVFGIETD